MSKGSISKKKKSDAWKRHKEKWERRRFGVTEVGKGKVVPVRFNLSITPLRRTGGVEVLLHEFLTSALDRGELSVSRPGRFTPRERAPGTHWREATRAHEPVWTVVKRKIPKHYQESSRQNIQPVAQRYTNELHRLLYSSWCSMKADLSPQAWKEKSS
jgi:hypothetical protein